MYHTGDDKFSVFTMFTSHPLVSLEVVSNHNEFVVECTPQRKLCLVRKIRFYMEYMAHVAHLDYTRGRYAVIIPYYRPTCYFGPHFFLTQHVDMYMYQLRII